METTNQLDEKTSETILEINRELDTLGRMPQADKERKNADIKSMIHYFVDETAKIEERRIKMSDFAWQTLGLMVAAFGVVTALNIAPIFKIPFYAILIVMVCASIGKLIEYTAQSRFRYPFLKIKEYSNRWKWFYNGNPKIMEIRESPFGLTPARLKEDNFHYLDGFNLFVGNYLSETIDREISDNLGQLYLLEVHNYYKNRFYLRLLKYDTWMQWIIITLLIAYIVFIIVCLIFFPGLIAALG